MSQVLLHAEMRPVESLGVITMGIKHANRIQAALDRALDLRPELADFFSLDREERFFVKNLETVQGDERDAIILSIGYGKAANGDLPHRFGPLTQEVGYRRLNVAVTRAKRRMCVISSFSHDDIDLDRSGSRGVQLLKAYLEYAAGGGKRMPEAEQAGEVRLNAFEADVRDALEARGIRTRPQFGASSYRIDLVAMHPESQAARSLRSSATVRHITRVPPRATAIACGRLTCTGWAGGFTVSGRRTGSTTASRKWSAPFPPSRMRFAWPISGC